MAKNKKKGPNYFYKNNSAPLTFERYIYFSLTDSTHRENLCELCTCEKIS
jgi:hypothetical protein